MPSSKLFRLEILVKGESIKEFDPLPDDIDYPLCSDVIKSDLDRVCYVQAVPGSEFTAKVTYVGGDELSRHHAYMVYLFADGKEVGGRIFYTGKAGSSAVINAKNVAGNMEQPYIFVSNQLVE
jgi:hypothetical protein